MAAQRTQTLTLRRQAKVNWHPPMAKRVVPATVLRVDIDYVENHTEVLIELLRPGGGYNAGDTVLVSAQRLSARGRE